MTALRETVNVGLRVDRSERPARGARRCRPLTVFDMMIMVAATAVGLGLDQSFPLLERAGIPRPWAAEFPCLAVWTLATLGLRLRRPRPAFRSLMRQPGALAVVVVTALVPLVLVTDGLARGVKAALRLYGVNVGGFSSPTLLVSCFAATAGAVVTGAWLGLALSGRRRPELGWIDATGRAIGTLWVVHFGAFAVFLWMHYNG